MRKAPWPDFEGKEIHEGDVVRHPSGDDEVALAADLAQQFNEAGYNFVSLSYRDDDEFKAEAIVVPPSH